MSLFLLLLLRFVNVCSTFALTLASKFGKKITCRIEPGTVVYLDIEETVCKLMPVLNNKWKQHRYSWWLLLGWDENKMNQQAVAYTGTKPILEAKDSGKAAAVILWRVSVTHRPAHRCFRAGNEQHDVFVVQRGRFTNRQWYILCDPPIPKFEMMHSPVKVIFNQHKRGKTFDDSVPFWPIRKQDFYREIPFFFRMKPGGMKPGMDELDMVRLKTGFTQTVVVRWSTLDVKIVSKNEGQEGFVFYVENSVVRAFYVSPEWWSHYKPSADTALLVLSSVRPNTEEPKCSHANAMSKMEELANEALPSPIEHDDELYDFGALDIDTIYHKREPTVHRLTFCFGSEEQRMALAKYVKSAVVNASNTSPSLSTLNPSAPAFEPNLNSQTSNLKLIPAIHPSIRLPHPPAPVTPYKHPSSLFNTLRTTTSQSTSARPYTLFGSASSNLFDEHLKFTEDRNDNEEPEGFTP